MDMIQ